MKIREEWKRISSLSINEDDGRSDNYGHPDSVERVGLKDRVIMMMTLYFGIN